MDFRHFKSTDGSRYWDEIIVAGEIPSGDSPQATNPPKLGTVAAPPYETGDGSKDWEYSTHQVTGTPGTYTTKIVTTGGGLGVGDGEAPAVGDIGEITNTILGDTVWLVQPLLLKVLGNLRLGASDASATLVLCTGGSITITWATGPQTVTVTALWQC